MNDESTSEPGGSSGFLDRIKESPRTVSALIIILIVAAAIYAFSGEPTQPAETAAPEEAALTTNEEATEAGEAEGEGTTEPQATATRAATEGRNQKLPEAQRQDNAFVEVAQAGDGITHLARRAADRWLAENNAGYEVTNEHRIYIEDYIKDKTGREGLKIGETRAISFDLIAEAVQRAGELNEKQLRNLSQYTAALN